METDITISTLHVIDRMKERCNIKSLRSAEKNIALAMKRGKRAEDCTSWERSYLSHEAYDGCFAVAYNNYCYIISDTGYCITLYKLPAWFGKKKHFDGKERIRDFKKYCKSNESYRERYIYPFGEALAEGC